MSATAPDHASPGPPLSSRTLPPDCSSETSAPTWRSRTCCAAALLASSSAADLAMWACRFDMASCSCSAASCRSDMAAAGRPCASGWWALLPSSCCARLRCRSRAECCACHGCCAACARGAGRGQAQCLAAGKACITSSVSGSRQGVHHQLSVWQQARRASPAVSPAAHSVAGQKQQKRPQQRRPTAALCWCAVCWLGKSSRRACSSRRDSVLST